MTGRHGSREEEERSYSYSTEEERREGLKKAEDAEHAAERNEVIAGVGALAAAGLAAVGLFFL